MFTLFGVCVYIILCLYLHYLVFVLTLFGVCVYIIFVSIYIIWCLCLYHLVFKFTLLVFVVVFTSAQCLIDSIAFFQDGC